MCIRDSVKSEAVIPTIISTIKAIRINPLYLVILTCQTSSKVLSLYTEKRYLSLQLLFFESFFAIVLTVRSAKITK
jgi:hypothetical protein